MTQILQQKKIPSREDWEKVIQSYLIQEKILREHVIKEYAFEQRARVAHIHVEKNTCSLCNRPHFQGGLCLLHFQQQYSKKSSIE